MGLMSAVIAIQAINAGFGARLGDQGENLIEEALMDLGEDYILIRNWVPPTTSKNQGDVDFVLLGPFGILVIEAKTFTVATKCVGDKWFVKRENGTWRPIKSISRQLERNVRAASRAFDSKARGVVVFNDRANLKLDAPTVEVIRRRELVGLVRTQLDSGVDANHMWKAFESTTSQLPTAIAAQWRHPGAITPKGFK